MNEPEMPTLPDGVRPFHRTPDFSAETMPEALGQRHQTKADVWGTLVVRRGTVDYHVLGDAPATHHLDVERTGIIAPATPHKVSPSADALFYVEFYR
ncbi:MAG: DUF1971 domain-containing protein [Anaerolineales bacterium]|nr:DUF1971 domain-containing protein [Anaerolineales bacterium]MCB9127284.1 DUF1971 domain-containing protein [Ardenticatenales bacterium]MCB9172573.1 DUF1971 domain-containing protein [Ardenticatenales bacterium]